MFYSNYIKRLIDALVSLVLLLALLPLLLLVALVVRVFLGSPVLFRQKRPGLKGQIFTMLKFRTMSTQTHRDGRLLEDAERLGRVGHVLRLLSLDELPQLWNVLKAEMSLIGPRPLLVEYLDKYTPEQARRHEVRPGITGLAQVRGRNDIPFSQRLAYDVEYVDNLSFMLDVRILFETVLIVLTRRGTRPVQDIKGMDDLGLYAFSENEKTDAQMKQAEGGSRDE